MLIRDIINGIIAGILISIGGGVFLSCENRYVGAVLFSVALLCICIKQYSLFTGKIGFIPEKHGKREITVLLLGLLGNVIGTFIFGIIIRTGVPALEQTALTMCEAKLNQTIVQTFIRAVMCGILMYLAVSIYRDNKTIVGILFCIPVFILSCFEHSIADMAYFSISGIVSFKAFFYIWNVILGNAIGGVLIPLLQKIGKEEKANA